ncbi:ParB-like partition protein (plasmid) [Caballeronia insecticola]|uniref:ParB-like partition protein n=2 Tax=Caballeronia insecticola TaxID=758793 RepID=R4X4E0_9BURK|nr:ParB-like partition protein [Caballeronia insecticola]
MMNKTAEVRAAKDIKLDPQQERSGSPRTAPGMAGALAAAQQRIAVLEKVGPALEASVSEMTPNPWQPRQVFNDAKLSQLAESIRETGLVQPIIVRRSGAGFQIVAGERRWRAHKMIGLATIKALVVDLSDEEMAMLALVENVAREDLCDYEISRSIRQTEREFPNRKRMAEALGISRSELYRFLAFAELPQFVVQDLEVQPRLLGASAAEAVVSVLRNKDSAAIEGTRTLWAQVVSGELDQSKFAKAIKHALDSTSGPKAPAGERSIDKIFAGGAQAGSITKDAAGLTVKIKTGALTTDRERRIRDLIVQLFAGDN